MYHNDTGAVLELQSIQWSEVVQPEIVIGLFGVIVLVCGTRLYRLSVMAPGFLLGWYLSLHIISGVSPAVQLMMVLFGNVDIKRWCSISCLVYVSSPNTPFFVVRFSCSL